MASEPFKCPICLEKSMVTTTVRYETSAQHGGSIYGITIPDLVILQCRKPACLNKKLTDAARARIDAVIREKIGILQPADITSIRMAAGLTRGQLAERLATSESLVGRWETGTAMQPIAMDERIRALAVSPVLGVTRMVTPSTDQ